MLCIQNSHMNLLVAMAGVYCLSHNNEEERGWVGGLRRESFWGVSYMHECDY